MHIQPQNAIILCCQNCKVKRILDKRNSRERIRCVTCRTSRYLGVLFCHFSFVNFVVRTKWLLQGPFIWEFLEAYNWYILEMYKRVLYIFILLPPPPGPKNIYIEYLYLYNLKVRYSVRDRIHSILYYCHRIRNRCCQCLSLKLTG